MNHHTNTADTEAAWRDLFAHQQARHPVSLSRLFAENTQRFEAFSLQFDDLLLDFSKTSINADTVALLQNLALATKVAVRRDAMFAGNAINDSENRAVLHTALRAAPTDGDVAATALASDAVATAIAARRRLLNFAERCRNSGVTAANGKAFTDVVNIGIGGSDLGPAMAVAALAPYHDGPCLHFVSNMDGAHLADTLAVLDARRTLVIISSKTFTTTETLANAERARQWLADIVGDAPSRRQLVAVTAATERARQWGCEEIFNYHDWVGGRYSLWGAVGLPLALAIGASHFEEFLTGGREIDQHFLTAPPTQNLPLMLGLIGVWHRNICDYPTRAILPYDQRLHLLPSYLQQLDMESNGKQAARVTAPVVWGSAGTNAQHAYFQMLHQGTDIIPCEFIIAARGFEADGEQQQLLVANCLAQSTALMRGDGGDESKPPHRRFAGNRPSVTLFYRQLTPRTFGRLISLFEHRTFVEGAVWGINSFDQWGVELGKTLAKRLHEKITAADRAADGGDEDSSTQGLLQHYRTMQRQ